MKKLLIVGFSLITLLTYCSKAHLKNSEGNQECLVSINPIGEISTSEDPLTKASTNNMYMLQVYQNDTSYAMGLFDDLSLMKVYLHKGLRYKFVVSVAYGMKGILSESGILTNIDLFYLSKKASSCFDVSLICRRNNVNYVWPQGTEVRTNLIEQYSTSRVGLSLNKVYYCHTTYNFGSFLYYTSYASTTRQSEFASNGSLFIRPSLPDIGKAFIFDEVNPINTTDWFYGEATFTPTGEYQTLDMNFKRVGYKLKYELNGVTDGEVTVTIKTQSNKILIQNTTNTETYSGETIFVPYFDIASVYQNPNNYYENLTVSVSWLRGIGVTQDLGSTTIQVKRNNLNKVKIGLGNSDQGASMTMSTEAESMGSESTDITLE